MVHKRECLFKIIVIGDISTGKTSLIQRFIHNNMSGNYKPTLGVDFATKLVQFEDTLIRLQFWDISDKTRTIRKHDPRVLQRFARRYCVSVHYTGSAREFHDLLLDPKQDVVDFVHLNERNNFSDLENTITGQMLDEYARQGGFKAGFKLSAKTGEGIEPAMDFLLRNVVCAEREGLYLMPMLQRDQNLHRLSLQELEQKKGRGGVSKKRFFQNTCC
uniref:Ras-related protein Rab-32 n=1 Tax=Globodera pallida TaxID=36090 RepID=A0A183BWF6_GLOPA